MSALARAQEAILFRAYTTVLSDPYPTGGRFHISPECDNLLFAAVFVSSHLGRLQAEHIDFSLDPRALRSNIRVKFSKN